MCVRHRLDATGKTHATRIHRNSRNHSINRHWPELVWRYRVLHLLSPRNSAIANGLANRFQGISAAYSKELIARESAEPDHSRSTSAFGRAVRCCPGTIPGGGLPLGHSSCPHCSVQSPQVLCHESEEGDLVGRTLEPGPGF